MIISKKFSIYILILLFLFLPDMTKSQEVKVKNVSFEQINDTILISYDLFGTINKKFKVSLSLSENNGISYSIIPKAVHGDIGDDVVPGTQKQIIWDFTKDYPAGLEGEEFVFAVEAEIRDNGSKLHYYFLGAGAVGAAGAIVYFLTRDTNKELPSSNGSLNIVVPGDVN